MRPFKALVGTEIIAAAKPNLLVCLFFTLHRIKSISMKGHDLILPACILGQLFLFPRRVTTPKVLIGCLLQALGHGDINATPDE